MLSNFAVLTDGGIWLADRRAAWPTETIHHVTDIARHALAAGLRAVWIHPESTIATKAKGAAFWHERGGWRFLATGPQGAVPVVARAHVDAPGKHDDEVFIYASFDKQWRGGVVGPNEMLRAIGQYEAALAHDTSWSPSRTAIESLATCNASAKRAAWLAPLSEGIHTGVPWPDHRAPAHVSKLVQLKRYAHVFDKSGAYLAAASGMQFGAGDPLLVKEYDPKAVGLWRISARATRDVDPGMPSPFSFSHGRYVEYEYFYSPQVEIARRYGWDVTVHGGYVWGESHGVMKEWAAKLYTAREEARRAGDYAAVAMIKASYTQMFGIMAYIPPERKVPTWHMRPDWAGLIVAESYARQLGTIRTLTERYGPCYFAVSTDAIALLSDEADPWLAFPYLAERRERIGAYKHMYTVKGPGDLIIEAARGTHAPEIMSMIGRLAHA